MSQSVIFTSGQSTSVDYPQVVAPRTDETSAEGGDTGSDRRLPPQRRRCTLEIPLRRPGAGGVWIAGAAPAQTVSSAPRTLRQNRNDVVTAKPQSGRVNHPAGAVPPVRRIIESRRRILPYLEGVVTASFDDEPLDNALRVSPPPPDSPFARCICRRDSRHRHGDTVAALSCAVNVAANATVVV